MRDEYKSRELINRLAMQLARGTGPTEVSGITKRHIAEGTSGSINDYERFSQSFNVGPTKEQELLRMASGYPEGDYGFERQISSQFRGMENEILRDMFSTVFRDKQGNVSTMFPETKVTAKAHDAIDKEMSINDLVSLLGREYKY